MIGLLIGVGISIVAATAIGNCICNELSENERGKQEKYKEDIEKNRRICQDEIEKFNNYKRKKSDEIRKSYINRKEISYAEIEWRANQEIEHEKKLVYSRLNETRANEIIKFIGLTDERIEDNNKLYGYINKAINLAREQVKQHQTAMRGNSLRSLMRELFEAKEKCIAYKNYLINYKKYIVKYCEDYNKTLEVFEFILPENFLYQGKLLFLDEEEVKRGKINVPFCYPLKFVLEDAEEENDDGNFSENKIPLLCYNYCIDDYNYYLSKRRGMVKNIYLINQRIGIPAIVTEIMRAGYKLDASGIPAEMYKNHLENPAHPPMIGAEILVYPIDWNPRLTDMKVTQNASEAMNSFSFDNLPLVISQAKKHELIEYIKKHNLLDCKDEWKIAPFDETKLPEVKNVKFQLGTFMIFHVSVVTENIGTKKDITYFRYEAVIDIDTYGIKSDDIFTAVDCSVTFLLEDDIWNLYEENKTVYQNVADLSVFIFTEFKNQNYIKSNQAGMLYFTKWEEITNKLIIYKYKGKSVTDEIAGSVYEEESSRENLVITFNNPDKINRYYEDISDSAKHNFKRRRFNFFLEINQNQYLFFDGNDFSPDCSQVTIQLRALKDDEDKQKARDMFSAGKQITIYCQEVPYAEIQQKHALSAFRMGKMANKYLQICALDGGAISHEPLNVNITEFKNEKLLSDLSQKETVERALDEKNIFIVQGPPGTGKTTVIIEMIRQIISGSSRILVVSQANVAVDNIIKRLIDDYPDKIIRCGTSDKIAPQVKPVSFDEKYANYIEKIKTKRDDKNIDQKLLKRWLDIVQPEYGHNPEIGELLMRTHKIIGATCIGLSKKRIGLERLNFDLVIIDEAGKALPAEILVPFIRAKKAVIIGDHKQLPPTIDPALYDNEKIEIDNRDMYKGELFDNSFFYRIWEQAPESNKIMLTTQYRMPTVIGSLISSLYYDNELRNGASDDEKQSIISFCNKNICLIDMSNIVEYQENDSDKRVKNEYEASLVVRVISHIRRDEGNEEIEIAVITPYKFQKRVINEALRNSGMDKNVFVNTVDAFQGDEADIVIYCTTRAKKPTMYFSDFRRVNVALSRTRKNLIIIGALKYFKHEKFKDNSLPKIAEYLNSHAEIINPEIFKSEKMKPKSKKVIDIVAIEKVRIHYDKEPDKIKIEKHKEYYINNDKFIKPLPVKTEEDYFVVNSDYEIFEAALELELFEIEVEII